MTREEYAYRIARIFYVLVGSRDLEKIGAYLREHGL